jgi:hypothetical protein
MNSLSIASSGISCGTNRFVEKTAGTLPYPYFRLFFPENKLHWCVIKNFHVDL